MLQLFPQRQMAPSPFLPQYGSAEAVATTLVNICGSGVISAGFCTKRYCISWICLGLGLGRQTIVNFTEDWKVGVTGLHCVNRVTATVRRRRR